MGNPLMRGRNGGNYMPSGGRNYYDQMSSSYSNQPQPYYHHHNSQNPPVPLHIGLSYHDNRQQPSSGSRQRLNSNRSNNNRNYHDEQSNRDEKRLTPTTSSSSHDINTTALGMFIKENRFIFILFSILENRPRLQLLPRSQKLSSSADDNQPTQPATRNLNIFGSGK